MSSTAPSAVAAPPDRGEATTPHATSLRLGTAAAGELPGATPAGPEGGNIVALHHLNFCVTDYYHGMVFYSEGLGATFSTAETAFDRGGLPVAWYNLGHQQFHVVKAEEAQVLRGFVTLTVPSLDRLEARLQSVASELAGTRFAFRAFPEDGDCPRSVTVRCPWGNAFHVLESAAGAGIRGVHFDCAEGESGVIAEHFERLFGAAVRVPEDGVAEVGLGASSFFAFQGTGALPAGFPESLDHLHVAMFVEDFDAAFSSFEAAGLLDTEHRFADKAYSLQAAHEHKQFRVRDVVAEDGRLVYQLELEVRSKAHASFGKRLQARPL